MRRARAGLQGAVVLLLGLCLAAPPLPAQHAAPAPPAAAPASGMAAGSQTTMQTPASLQSCGGRGRATTSLIQLAGGTAAGVVTVTATTLVLALAGLWRYAATDGRGHQSYFGAIQWVAYPSYVLGSAVGVQWIGEARGYEGHFWPTLAGSALGFGAPGATLAYHVFDPSRRAPRDACAAPSPEPPPAPDPAPGPPRLELTVLQLRF